MEGERWCQIYSLKKIDLDEFKLNRNPYREDAQDERNRLQETGVVFFRDEDHTHAAISVTDLCSNDMTHDGYYYQFSYSILDGSVSETLITDQEVRITDVRKNQITRVVL